MEDSAQSSDSFGASMVAQDCLLDEMQWAGTMRFEFTDSDGNILRVEECSNLLTTVGKSQLLNTGWGGTTAYMGLISVTSFTTLVVGDTMTSHAGWLESGNAHAPTYTAPRGTAAFATASGGSIALSGALSFVFTGAGTVEGGFLVGGTGATSTIDNTGGVLMAEGTLSTPQPVISTNTLNMSYSGTLT